MFFSDTAEKYSTVRMHNCVDPQINTNHVPNVQPTVRLQMLTFPHSPIVDRFRPDPLQDNPLIGLTETAERAETETESFISTLDTLVTRAEIPQPSATDEHTLESPLDENLASGLHIDGAAASTALRITVEPISENITAEQSTGEHSTLPPKGTFLGHNSVAPNGAADFQPPKSPPLVSISSSDNQHTEVVAPLPRTSTSDGTSDLVAASPIAPSVPNIDTTESVAAARRSAVVRSGVDSSDEAASVDKPQLPNELGSLTESSVTVAPSGKTRPHGQAPIPVANIVADSSTQEKTHYSSAHEPSVPIDTESISSQLETNSVQLATVSKAQQQPTNRRVNAPLPNQVSGHILMARQSLSEGKAQLEVMLDPPELGKITIELTETRDSLTARLVVAEGSTLDNIKRSLPTMVDSLADAGVSLDNLQLESSGSNGRSMRDPGSGAMPGNSSKEADSRSPSEAVGNASMQSRGVNILA